MNWSQRFSAIPLLALGGLLFLGVSVASAGRAYVGGDQNVYVLDTGANRLTVRALL